MAKSETKYSDFDNGQTKTMREITRKGRWPNDNSGPGRSTGETPGAGTIYTLAMVERPNMSNNRNQGPTRPGSRSAADGVPIVTMGSRATGRVTGSDEG